jgi:2-oxoglutarate ferredoxin oxidoreductase subunit beta
MHDRVFHFCPGCGHSLAHRLVCEVIDELGIEETTIGVGPVGCAWNPFHYINVDFVYSLHGRAPAVATGIKRAHPDKVVFTYQGDGDLASIGMAEIVHAAVRSERISVVFVNNAVFGMTGAQMAPTSLIGQVTSTSPLGRDSNATGYPIRVSEFLAQLEGVRYAERCALDSPANVRRAKAAIKRVFENQLNGHGFSIVELLSPCPEGWHMPPAEALVWLRQEMAKQYPLGKIKDLT